RNSWRNYDVEMYEFLSAIEMDGISGGGGGSRTSPASIVSVSALFSIIFLIEKNLSSEKPSQILHKIQRFCSLRFVIPEPLRSLPKATTVARWRPLLRFSAHPPRLIFK